jgi:ribosome modulation factor
MSGYDNTNKGILGRNDRKTQDNHPDFSGSINVDGRDYWLSGWIKERKDGSGRFFSLSVKPKDGVSGSAAPRPAPADLDDEIPF